MKQEVHFIQKNINYAQRRLSQLLKIGNYRGGGVNNQIARERQPIQSKCYAWNNCPDFLVDDIDNPYTTPEDKPFIWVRGRQVGGRMVVKGHGRQLYRFSDFQFKAASRDGHGEDWPISYADLESYYERVERWIGIRGTVENIPHLPDSVFLSEGNITLGDQLLKSALESTDYRLILGRMAPPRPTVSAAMKTGRLTLRPYAMVSHIIVDEDSSKAKGVAFIDQRTHKSYEAFGKVVVLCASTIESTRILLNSATQQHPTGLGNSSGLLGRYLMDHTSIEINGIIPKSERLLATLPKNSNLFGSIYIPQFKNIADHHNKFIRGYGIQTKLYWEPRKRLQGEPVVKFLFAAFGEMLPRFENQVTINKDLKDAWGIPVPHIECIHSDNEREMGIDMLQTLKKIADAAGFEVLEEERELLLPGLAVHECGTARMGDDPKKSVLNKFNQSWDIKNLFVVDGACFVSQGCQNPTLTMMAIAARACDYIVYEYQKGNL